MKKTLCGWVVVMAAGHPAWAAQEDAVSKTHWIAQCEALARADFSGILDAPTQITVAQPVATASDVPAYCRVEGYVSPNVGIEVRLPATQWNGKFIEVGCGGTCGAVFASACDEPLRKAYACIASDMGHKGHKSTLADQIWAYNNLQAKIDFGFRATHVAALAGKAITERYYGKRPARSYFVGCSTGGRQGLVEAQRFPWDFNGIIAGAPAMYWPAINMGFLWQALTLKGNDGAALLGSADIKLVHQAAIAQCDRDDGLVDGVIGHPRACRFDPASLACSAGTSTGCLSRPQVQALQKLYAGLTTPTGDRISQSLLPGAETELRWMMSENPLSLDPLRNQDMFRYGAFLPDPGPTWKASDMDYARDYQRLGMMEAIYGASNPDLREFKAAGGKLLLYHGWGDVLPPQNTVDYYETVERTMGGRAATQDFLRLFMIAGMGHCGGGEGAWAIDYLSHLEAWVEQGRAPDMLLGAHVKEDNVVDVRLPLDPAQISFTRPVYPYPLWARYKGTGNPNDAASFRPAER